MITIPDLMIDCDGDDPDTHILLEQDDGSGSIQRIALHPIQVRLLAERMGLLAPSAGFEADRTIASLCRQMRTLHHRINTLDDWLAQADQRGHEDLTLETTYSLCTWEMSAEFLKQLPFNEQGELVAEPNTPESGVLPTSKSPKNGGVCTGKTPKSGVVSGQAQGARNLERQQ